MTIRPAHALSEAMAAPALRFDDARSDWIVFAACLAMWGSAFAALKIAHDGGISPAWVTTGRMVVACAFLLLVLALTKQRLPPLSNRRAWGVFAIIGVIGTALPFLLFAWASGRADSAVVAICNGGSPFFTSLLAHAFLRNEKLTPNRIVGVGLGFAGLVTLAAPAFDAGVNAEALGIVAGVAGAACYGLANVLIRAAPDIKPTTGATMYCLFGLAAVAPVALLSGPAPAPAPADAWLAVAALGLFSTALGGMGYVHLVARRGPVLVSFITYLIPLWATAIGMVFLGERPGWTAFFALLLIIAGLVVSQRKSS
jgi:drug/metabolite transporter (DMT)-like permease